jgi:hypothetical protein
LQDLLPLAENVSIFGNNEAKVNPYFDAENNKNPNRDTSCDMWVGNGHQRRSGMTPINESVVEQAALAWLDSLGYSILYSPEIAPGDETLQIIAQELVRAVRGNLKIDWTVRENVRAEMRVMIKRILRRYGYPPDRQARATELVLEQAEVLCQEWTVS